MSKLEPWSIEPGSAETIFGRSDIRYSDLAERVRRSLDKASWWDVCGEDITIMVASLALFLPFGLYCMASANPVSFAVGVVCLGYLHGLAIVKIAHSFSHTNLGLGESVQKALQWFSIEFIGSFPTDLAYEGHVQVHHPHTNVIGLGDSSTWKVPVLGRWAYLVLAPLFLPAVTPLIGWVELRSQGAPVRRQATFGLSVVLGWLSQWLLYTLIAGLTPLSAAFWCAGTRAVFMPCYIHVNIFQHIGLSFYSPDNRPDRLNQMTHGVLNLSRHPILDFNFGHSIINCHVEHHLFPRLSDKLCLRVKPIVKEFCTEHGLPYFEKTYANRLLHFFYKYEELMVNAPPITSFVSVQ